VVSVCRNPRSCAKPGKGGKKHRKYPQPLLEAQKAAAAEALNSKEKKEKREKKDAKKEKSKGKESDEKASEPKAKVGGGVDKLKRSLWPKLILSTLREKGVEWEGYLHALSLKRLQKECISKAALQAKQHPIIWLFISLHLAALLSYCTVISCTNHCLFGRFFF